MADTTGSLGEGAAAAVVASSSGSSEAPLLLGFGNPTVDATIEMTKDEIASLGLEVGADAAGSDQAFKERLAKYIMMQESRRELSPGGAALNSMRVAAWLGKGSLRVAFLGSVGTDHGAEVLREAMAQVQVLPLLLSVPDLPTGVCGCLVDSESKERSLVVSRGAAGAMTPTFLDSADVAPCIAEAALIYVTAFVLSTPPRAECAARLAQAAKSRSAAFALNLSSASLLGKVHAQVSGLLPSCRYLFGNVGEVQAFAKLSSLDEAHAKESLAPGDVEEASSLMQRLAGILPPGCTAVITAGADATWVVEHGGLPRSVPVERVPAEEVVDTNGCGDAFTGGFLFKAALGAPVDECIDAGHKAAALVLRSRGCTLPV